MSISGIKSRDLAPLLGGRVLCQIFPLWKEAETTREQSCHSSSSSLCTQQRVHHHILNPSRILSFSSNTTFQVKFFSNPKALFFPYFYWLAFCWFLDTSLPFKIFLPAIFCTNGLNR
jgi:hypothetical protein